jgi:hypothetical protein
VQAALRRYARDVNQAVAEALRVQDLEQLLEARDNPFVAAFRDFERQARDRLRIARDYGFDVLEIERVNAEERKRLIEQTLESTARSARELLNELRFGSRAEGSPLDQLAALDSERRRLQAAFDGGDAAAGDALAALIERQLDVARDAFGTTGPFAGVRSDAITALERIVQQTESRIAEASLEAQRETVARLTEANVTLDEQAVLQQQILAELQRFNTGAGAAASALDFSALFARAAV